MKRRSLLISFSGTDCSGKSTQISLLSDNLKLRGKKVDILWARGGYTSNFQRIKYILRFFLKKKVPSPGQSKLRSRLISNKFIAWTWINLALLDLIFLWALVIRIKLILGRYIICDRYIDDTKLDFEMNFSNLEIRSYFLWKILELVCPKPDISFMLFISVKESKKRSLLKIEPFPDSEESLSWRLDKYLDNNYFPSRKYKKIQTNKSVISIYNIIKRNIEENNQLILD